METFLIGLGSNLGDRYGELVQARSWLSLFGRVVASSRLYETEPVGPGTADFLNAAIRFESRMEPLELLKIAKTWERDRGRRNPEIRWTDRPIDLDLLSWSGKPVHSGTLRLPHAGLFNRRFVLFPVLDVAPEFIHPELNRPATELLAESPEIRIAITKVKW